LTIHHSLRFIAHSNPKFEIPSSKSQVPNPKFEIPNPKFLITNYQFLLSIYHRRWTMDCGLLTI